MVRERLAADAAWKNFTTDQRRWVCPFCLSAVSRRPQRSWDDSIGAHLEICRHYGAGRFAPQPPAAVQAQLSFENMVCRAETDAAWQVFDTQGMWICPACLDKIPDARLVANQRNTLTYRGMALHLQRCAAYGAGTINAAPVVRSAKDRPAGAGGTRATTSLGLPVRTPAGGAPTQAFRATPGGPIAMPGSALSVEPTARPSGLPPVAQPLAPPTPRAPVVSIPPASGVTTGSHLRMRRFITPAPDTAAQASAPEAPVEPEAAGFSWMDDADAAAGSVETAPAQPHLERSDLMRARDLQQKMLAEAPEIPGYVFATRYEPCDHVSGDFFSFIRLLDGRFGFAIGDVSGHGMQAGLVMSMAKKTLEIYGELIGDPAEVLAKVNDALAGDLGGKMFVSMTYAILSPSERTIRWVRAGHNPTLATNAKTREVVEIKPPGMVVGMKGGQIFRDSLQVETTHLNSGDTFLLYTDGVTEMTNAQGEEFDTARLREVMDRCAADGPDALLTQVMDRIRHFRGSQPIGDDVTLLALAVS
jgi:serine phosphatase RsbU (regulator of sigma subunit)